MPTTAPAPTTDNFQANYAYATTPDDAQASGKSLAKRLKRAKKSFEVTMPGTLSIVAGSTLTLSGFHSGVDSLYTVVSVRHSLSRSGWITNLSGEGADADA